MPTRRRIDQVLDPEFITSPQDIDIDELRARRLLAGEVENELSYYRRMLHGRLDLIRFELSRAPGPKPAV